MKLHPRIFAFALFCPISSLATESTFSEGNEGWIIIDHQSSTNPLAPAGIIASDGNPLTSDGSLVVQDIGNDWNWIVAPEKFHVDWTGFTDLELDMITDDATTLFNLRLFIADGVNSAWFEFPISGTPGGSVLNLSASLEESEWNVTGDWEQLIANVSEFSIRIDLNNNVAAEADFVDRVALVDGTEPPDTTFPVTFPTEIGCEYQIESSFDLESWKNVGAPLPGDGLEITVDVPLSDAPRRFFRARTIEKP